MPQSLTIGIDASRAARANRTGTENYSVEIIDQLIRIKSPHKFVLYSPNKPTDRNWDLPNVTWKIIPPRRLWSQIGLSGELRNNPPDVLFVPSHVVPLLSHVPSVVTIHDLAYEYFAAAYTPFERKYTKYSTGVSMNKSRVIVVPSKATKDDILKFYPVEAKKVRVIPHGYNNSVYRADKDFGAPPIDNPYFLTIGRLEERKNTALLVEAFSIFAREQKNVSLVLAGKTGWGFEKIQKVINGLPENIKSRIVQTGYLPAYDAARYLKHSVAFVFPSLYEGFGLPVLEAFGLGTPVICSNTSSLAEVAGEAAVTLKPSNPMTWAAAMSRVFSQKDLANSLRAKGLERAKQFSWSKAAEETLKAIEAAAKDGE
ncbi:MAG TPA: glycosyltransferase family 1 protein [Candidatus Saccharimonadales bacterium]|nr:glycosyltransferase family 1 protein [Candidatus Saccharimonadales bacterium]